MAAPCPCGWKAPAPAGDGRDGSPTGCSDRLRPPCAQPRSQAASVHAPQLRPPRLPGRWGQDLGNIFSEGTQILGLVLMTKRLLEVGSKEKAPPHPSGHTEQELVL